MNKNPEVVEALRRLLVGLERPALLNEWLRKPANNGGVR